jgi:serine/threonine protein kinase/outer membrane protein assembly factor BamB
MSGTASNSSRTTSGRRAHRTLPSGTVLENRYEVQRVAGRGGMSTVYAARDLRFNQVDRICAIKEMFDIDPDARVRAMRLVNFEREAALLATLSHPAIPRIYDYFAANGLVYLVLEFIDGQDLERLLSTRKLPFSDEQVTRWALEIASVLEMLHAQQPDPIIFRDLKPSNIMLRGSGQVVLVDFGIARTIQGRQRGTMIGTEGYAPPEQYRGIADARGDIYALGATMHHLLTNSDPRLETPFTFQERMIRSINPEISDELAAVVSKMLSYNPDERYQSVAELRVDLEAVQRHSIIGRLTQAGTPPTLPPVAVPTPLDAPPTPTPPIPEPVPVAQQRAAARKRGARRRRSEFEQPTERLVWATQTGDEVRGSATFDGSSFLIGSYDQHVYAVSPTDGAVRWRFRTSRGVVSRPVLADNVAIVGSEDHSIYAVDRARAKSVWSYRTGMSVRSSPEVFDEYVVVGSDDTWLYCLESATGSLAWRQRTWGPIRSSPVTVEDAVIVGSDDGYLYSMHAGNGRVNWRVACGGPIQSAPVVDHDRVLVASRGGLVTAVSARRGERVWQFDARSPLISSPRTVNGVAVVGAADGALFGLSVEDGGLRWTSRFANQITATALLTDRVGYVGTIDGDFVCFSCATGELIWRHQIGGSIVSTPAYGSGVLVVGSTDGRICGIALTDTEVRAFEKGS